MDIKELAPGIIANMIPESRFNERDQAAISKNKEYLLGLSEDLVHKFYDAAYGHKSTAEIFEEGERPAREQTLRDWWARTVSEPIDEQYAHWMTLVGVVHIRRRVKNPMMLGMVGYIIDHVNARAREDLDEQSATELSEALGHLRNLIASLISDSYTQSFIGSLESLAGLSPALTDRMLSIEITRLEEEGRQGLR